MWLHIKNSLIVKVLANDVRILFQPPTYRIVFFNPKYRDQRIHTSYILNRFKRNFVVVNFQFLCPGGVGGTRVNFCWVYAVVLSEPLSHLSLFRGHLSHFRANV